MLNAKQVQTAGRTDDIYYGVDGADLVEVDLINLDAVDAGLGLGQSAEYPGRLFFHRRCQTAFVY